MSRIRRAVVLARGLGTRMRRPDAASALDAPQASMADAGLKVLMPVGRPFLDYVLGSLIDVGITEICLVIGDEHQVIRDRYERDCVPTRARLHYAIQAAPEGTAHAVLAASGFIAGHDVMVVNADNLYPPSALEGVIAAGAPSLAAFSADVLTADGSIEPARIAQFAIIDTDGRGALRAIIEKPPIDATRGPGVRVSMNLWAFPPAILEACARIPLSPRGEYELPDAVRYGMAHLGMTCQAVPIDAPVLDLSTRADIAAVRARVEGIEVRL